MRELVIEAGGSDDSGPCECCGGTSRTIWGYVYDSNGALAAYFVHWTRGQVPRHGANFDLIVGTWGEGSIRSERSAVSLALRVTSSGPAFMVIDSEARPVATNDLVGNALSRAEVVGTPTATLAFAIVDAIWLQEKRISEIVQADEIQ